jgi:ethanolamine utilization protein EutA (predicted chaperonin)
MRVLCNASGHRAAVPVMTTQATVLRDVWGAACHAQRINGAYLKQDEWELPSENATAVQLRRKSNRNIMMEALENPFMITDEDRQQVRSA